jgi:hypothetical protein
MQPEMIDLTLYYDMMLIIIFSDLLKGRTFLILQISYLIFFLYIIFVTHYK